MGGRGDGPRPPMSLEEVEMAHGPDRSEVPRAELVIGGVDISAPDLEAVFLSLTGKALRDRT